jgi:two-component system chemotaxis response regulator CheB
MIRLLVADDSALMRKLLTQIFEEEGDFEVRTARDGEELLALARTFRPNVVTLDVNMPVMDGLTCLGRLMVETPCPVVMVSSQTVEGAEATMEALRLGAVDFVPKPEGAISLGIDRVRPVLVEKVRMAARVRLRSTLRLADRVRHQIGQAARPHDRPDPPRPARPAQGLAQEPAQKGPAQAPYAPALPDPSRSGLVLLGASTGGPRAVEMILSALPHDFPWPVLVAQHMPATFTGIFARRLQQHCALSVVEAARAMPLRTGYVYIGRGDADLVVARRPSGLFALPVPASQAYRWHPSVDRLVTSALDHVGARRLLGVLVTGMGDDGAASMARLRAEGGRTIAEDESTAIVWGMPGELVKRNGADQVLALPDIGPALSKAVR